MRNKNLNSIKNLLKMVLCLAVLLWVPFVLVACGDDNTTKVISGFEYDNQFVTVTYKTYLNFPYQAFGVKVVYSDGTKVNIDELSEDAAAGIEYKITKWNESTQQNEEWNSQYLTVGSYNISFTYGNNVRSSASLYVDKGDYTNPVYPNISTRMVYGGILAKPSVTLPNNVTFENIRYYYQRKTDDGSYSEIYFTYEYAENAICDITPGDYQLFAEIETDNYNPFRTELRGFTVVSADEPKNYAFFERDYERDQEGNYLVDENGGNIPVYTPLSANQLEVTWDPCCETVSDYFAYFNSICVFEVDENNEMVYDEFGNNHGGSVLSLFEEGKLTLQEAQNFIVNEAKTYSFNFWYTSDVVNYKPKRIGNFRLIVNKKQIDVSDNVIQIYVGDSQVTQGNIEYDGEEHHIVNRYHNARKESNQWFGYESSFKNGEEILTNLYRISGYVGTNVGTYNVVYTVLSELRNRVEFKWTNENSEVETGYTRELGSWRIRAKDYNIETNIDLTENNHSIRLDDNNNTYLLFGHTYTVSTSDIVAKRGEEVDSNIVATFTGITAWEDSDMQVPATGITIDNENKTVTIANDCPHEYIYLNFTFGIDNPNYSANSLRKMVYLRNGVNYLGLTGTILNFYGWIYGDENIYVPDWEYTYCETNSSNLDANEYFVSADTTDYSKWMTVYNQLYLKNGQEEYELNNSDTIDWNQIYYMHVGSDYVPVKFYYASVVESQDHRVTQINNTVSYDGKIKVVEVELVPTNINKSDFYLNELRLEKLIENKWVEVTEAKGIGQYRSVYGITFIDNDKILVDAQGDYVTELYYEWEIVDDLPKIAVTDCSFTFKDKNGTILTPVNDTVTLDQNDGPLYVTATVTLDNQNVEYLLMYQYQDLQNTGSASLNNRPTFDKSGSYVLYVSIIVDGDYAITDNAGNVIEWVETRFTLNINE